MDAGLHARSGPARLAFGPFTIDVDRAEVSRDGAPLALRPKTFTLLLHLVDRPGKVVGKQELLDAVWPRVVVTDESLTQAVSELRGALGDREQTLIRTVSRRGYRFDGTVRALPPEADPPVLAASPGLPSRTRRWWTALVGTGALLVAALAFALVQIKPAAPTSIGTALTESRSLAVMPFTDLSEPPAPHLALAVDSDLAIDLGRLADTRVMARGSAAALGSSADVDLKRAAAELGVRYVVTGSVRRDGDALIITAQLVRTDTGAQLWGGRFDYVSAADWAARRDISARIANVLDVRMRDAALQQAKEVRPNNAAVDHWMRGTYILSGLKKREQLLQARSEFEAALAAQPDSSHALAGLASTHMLDVTYRWADDRKSGLETAERLARRALEIDSLNREALIVLGGVLMFDGRIDEGMAVTRKHLELNPNDAVVNGQVAGLYFFAGRWEDAIRQVELAIRLSPLDRLHVAACRSLVATALIPLRRYDEAIEQSRLILDGPRAGGAQMIASAEALRGNLDKAREVAAESLQRFPNRTIARERALRGSKVPAYLEGMDHYYEGLRLAGYPEGTVEGK